MLSIPKLSISREVQETTSYDPKCTYSFRYRARHHQELPHVVKFSGGRSSGMLLVTLLENGFLKQERGDVVVFNNTSCEHPETYEFVAKCKTLVEQAGIPFFIVEFQTYEDARQGVWRRIGSYRLANSRPHSEDNPGGFRWRGEVFEETLSNKSYLPNQFSRVCTQSLKLEVTREFLRDWFANKSSIPRLGHGLPESQVSLEQLHRQHVRHGGGVPRDILLAKKEFVLNQSTSRPKQVFGDFSPAAQSFRNPLLEEKVFGNKAWFGESGAECAAFIGLRGDEQLRVTRVETRSSNPHANLGYEGEHVYMPLATMHVARNDVSEFWAKQDWDLNLPPDGFLSNCVYCFLKGANNLARVHGEMERQKASPPDGYGPTAGTPSDINWWKEMEKRYGRDLEGEQRERTNPEAHSFIGFFGASSGFSYELLETKANDAQAMEQFAGTVLPCDCTE